MSKHQMSAKDKAFEQERVKYRKEIKELERSISSKNEEIDQLKNKLHELENEKEILEEWNNRLLEYCNMDVETLKKQLAKEKEERETYDNLKKSVEDFKSLLHFSERFF